MKYLILLLILGNIKTENELFLDVSKALKNLSSQNVTSQNCICVPYWQCKDDFSGLIEDGINMIDIRFRINKLHNGQACTGDFDVCCKVECGRKNINLMGALSSNDSFIYRILGDNNESDFGEFPWMLAILQHNIFICGASLIHPQVAITAAHCVSDEETYKIRAGEWNWATRSEPLPYQEQYSKKIIIHTKYRPENLENDVALIILEKPFQLSENVGIICLPNSVSISTKKCLASGWGKSSKGGPYQSILKKITLPIVSKDRCSIILGRARLGQYFELHKSFLCAGGDSIDTCKGDGGSPLMCPIPNHPSRYEQVGIVSWGLTCGIYKAPGVYVNVAFFIDWIDDEMVQNDFDTQIYKKT